MPDNRSQIRQRRLFDELDHHDLDAVALNPGPSLVYLTGLNFHLSERPVTTIFRQNGIPIIVLPELEVQKVRGLEYDLRAFTYGEDPSTWHRAFEDAASEAGLDYLRVGVEPTRLRVLELRLLEEAAPRAAYLSATEALAALRMVKDDGEVDSLRKAVRVAEQALENTLDIIKAGITEEALARNLTIQLYRSGSAPELPFSPIVAFGPNSAIPHAVPTNRTLQEGDLVLIDWGANVDGYFSDLTRMFCLGDPRDDIAEIVDVVARANEAARETAGPGTLASEVDRAARDLIESAGFGDCFTHRTGHGLGLEGHEDPYIRDGNEQELRPGMVFTVEPGIYLSGRGGARVEDDVVITADGAESLSVLRRDLVRVGGVGADASAAA